MRSRPQGASRPPGGVCATTGGSPSMRRGRVLASDAPGLPAIAEALAPSAPVPALAVRPVFAHSSALRVPSRDLRPTAGAPAVTVPLPAGCPSSASALAPAPRPAARFPGAPDAPAPAPPLLAGAPAADVAVLPLNVRLAVELQGAALVLSRDLPLVAGAPAPTALHLAELSIAPRAHVPAVRPAAAPLSASDAPAPAPPSIADAPAPEVAVLPPSVRLRVRFLYAIAAFARGFPSIVDPSPPDIPLSAGALETLAPAVLSAYAALPVTFPVGRVGHAVTRTGPCQEPPTSSNSEGYRLQQIRWQCQLKAELGGAKHQS